MMKNVLRAAVILAAGSVTLSQPVWSADTSNRVAADNDWSVFVEDSPKECWGVSAPKATVNTKAGKPVEVRRGDILLFVTYRPGKDPEVMFMGGYPFAPGKPVELSVGSDTFQLFTDGGSAWARRGEDQKIIDKLKSGAEAKLVGFSERGTRTEDTFSLMGFTAAVGEAAKRCH